MNRPSSDALTGTLQKLEQFLWLHKEIEAFNNIGDYEKPQTVQLVNYGELRCYQILKRVLIYKVSNSTFKGILIENIESVKVEGNADLIFVSKSLVDTKEWKWIKNFSKFLLKAGNKQIRKTLEKYASANFTKEELEINKNSGIKKEDMIAFAKQTLEQK